MTTAHEAGQVAPTTSPAEGLVRHDFVDGRAYTDPAVFEAELRRIFTDGWVFVGHESEIPEHGDYVTRRIGRDPVIMIRGRDGTVRVLANRCAHRGVLLLQAVAGNAKSLPCMFHGWTYGTEGELKGVPQPGGLERPKEECSLDRPGQVDTHRGFVFANQSGRAGSLGDHLGAGGKALIDWACDLSPVGELQIDAGWLGQDVASNWKMWAESDLDGYHLGSLHTSLWRVVPDTQYGPAVLAGENVVQAMTRDRGNGHVELEFWRGYDRQLAWLGVPRERVADYCDALIERHGRERAERLLWMGPPHALIFPNLFLGEMNVTIIEAVSPTEMVHWHTPVQLGGVDPALNARLRRQSEAAMGPAAFIVPDDAVVAERIQRGTAGVRPAWSTPEGERPARGWIDVSRGANREDRLGDGRLAGLISDETTNRGFWRQYREVMSR